jgi:GT2 family glycosyltransferase
VDATVVIPTVAAGERLRRALTSLAYQTAAHQVIVVDNGGRDATRTMLAREFPSAVRLAPGANVGFARAVNLAAARADGSALVLVNDDCVCEPTFVERIVAPLDPPSGTAMVAGVLCDADDPGVIDTAGIELDSTLLAFDYLHGEPLAVLAHPVADPIGPSGAAAAFDRAVFRSLGGFDEALFAYWEDVDFALRARSEGIRCVLAAGARGIHQHSGTLGFGSSRKNYLTGFGRGYLLCKWSVLTPRRIPGVLLRDGVICAGQALIDRNVAGVRGRVCGFTAARQRARRPYPNDIAAAYAQPNALRTLVRRGRRRARLRSRRQNGAHSSL